MNPRNIAIAVFVIGYFLSYPEEMKTALQPVAAILELTNAISPWLYMLLAVMVATWGVVKVWGRKGDRSTIDR